MILRPTPDAQAAETTAPQSARRRRAATSIEYAFVVSLILLGCIVGIQQLSAITKSYFSTSADKTKIMDPSQKGSP